MVYLNDANQFVPGTYQEPYLFFHQSQFPVAHVQVHLNSHEIVHSLSNGTQYHLEYQKHCSDTQQRFETNFTCSSHMGTVPKILPRTRPRSHQKY